MDRTDARDGKNTEPKRIGTQAEGVASRYLSSKGVKIIAHNVFNRGGEIDLIGYDGATLVFFEVRFRGANALVNPAESLTMNKRRALLRAASFYLYRNNLTNHPARIDLVAIMPGQQSRYRIQWIKNAVEAG